MSGMTGLTGEHPGLLAIYPGRGDYERLLAAAIAPLTAEQLALRPAPHLRSIADNVEHIVGARARWCDAQVTGLGDQTFAAFAGWDRPDAPERDAAELAHGLEHTWSVLANALGQMTLADLERTYPNDHPEPGEPEALTLRWVLWHLVEHDMHHGGEISQLLGMHGLGGLDI